MTAITLLGIVFAVLFACLAAGILAWLFAVNRKLGAFVLTIEALERQAGGAAAKAGEAAEAAAKTLTTLNSQLGAAAGLFQAVERIGGAADQASRTASRISGALADSADRHLTQAGGKYRKQLTEALDWAEIGFTVWQFWQSKRKEVQDSACSGQGSGYDKTE